MFFPVVLSNKVPEMLPRRALKMGPCTTRPPPAAGNCYSESWTVEAALINKVFISHFPWWFTLISPLIVLFHQTRSVCVCVCVCVCVSVCLCAPWSARSGPPSQWTAAANRLLIEAELKTAEGTFASDNKTVTSMGGGLLLIQAHASPEQLHSWHRASNKDPEMFRWRISWVLL